MYYIIKLHTVVIAEDLNLNYALYQTSSFKTDSFNILERILDLNTNEKVWIEHLKGNSVIPYYVLLFSCLVLLRSFFSL